VRYYDLSPAFNTAVDEKPSSISVSLTLSPASSPPDKSLPSDPDPDRIEHGFRDLPWAMAKGALTVLAWTAELDWTALQFIDPAGEGIRTLVSIFNQDIQEPEPRLIPWGALDLDPETEEDLSTVIPRGGSQVELLRMGQPADAGLTHLHAIPLPGAGGWLVMGTRRPEGPPPASLQMAHRVAVFLDDERATPQRAWGSDGVILDAEILNQAILSLATSLDLEEVLKNSLEALDEVLPFEAARIFLLSDDESRLVMAGWRRSGRWEEGANIYLPSGNPLLAQIRQQAKHVLITDPAGDPRLNTWPLLPHTSQWLALPLEVREELIGLLVLERGDSLAYHELQTSLAQAFAGQAAIAIQNARLFEQVKAGRERLRLLSRQLVEVQEAERRSIARELHDQIGQVITGLKLVLEMSIREPPDKRNDDLREALALVDELMAEVRELSLTLRPAMLDDLGLLPALLWHFDRYTAQTHIEVDFKQRGVEGLRFDQEIETAAYRIIQEALTNIARHAGVDLVTVRLWADDRGLYLQIEDRGSGFDPAAALNASGTSGLSGMRERAELLGGELLIDSQPGEGTILSASLPFASYFERRRKER
jgi:signal transduction histidine kinase